MKDIRGILIGCRIRSGLSQTDMAKEYGLALADINRFEKGWRQPVKVVYAYVKMAREAGFREAVFTAEEVLEWLSQ